MQLDGAIDLDRAEIAGHLIRDMRLARGWTQQQLSNAIEYSRTSITNMEQGRQVVTMDVLCQVAEVLGFSLQMRATSTRP